MLADFEGRLANVLGSRLEAPFAGRVRRRGSADPAGNGPVIRLAVEEIVPLEPDFGSVRPEVVPGSGDQRRIARLRATVGVEIDPQGTDRLQVLDGVDALIYELQQPEMRSAALLHLPEDQGFRLDFLHIVPSSTVEAPQLLLATEGWFWPIGAAGAAGVEIETAMLREFRLPVTLSVSSPLTAGGSTTSISLRFGSTGTLAIDAQDTDPLPFGSVALRLNDDGGGPGAGTLAGGAPGPDGTHVVPVGSTGSTFTYTPGPTAGRDHLSVLTHAVDADDNEHIGFAIARFALEVPS